MNHKQLKFQQVSKENAIHIVGEAEHNYLVQQVLALKTSTHREFVNSLGEHMFLRFVPMIDDVVYFIDDGSQVCNTAQ